MAVVFKNNAKTTLASGINSSATSITVSDGDVFPSLTGSDIFFVTFDDGTNNEIVKVTARSGNTLTVVRAQESTTARSFSTGDEAQLRLTAGILGLFSQTGVAITDEIEAYLDANGLTFPDNTQAKFGTDNDLTIDHSSATGVSRIIDNSGILNIQQSSDDGQIRFQCDDGSGGVTTYYQISGTNETNIFFKDLKLGDNVKALFGASNDLQIYHSSFDTYLTNLTGHLVLQNQANDKDIVLQTDNGSGGTADYLRLVGANTRMLASQHFRIADTKQLQLGDDNDFSANFNGNHTFLTNNTGILYLTQSVDDGVIRIRNDDGSGGVTDYINLHGGTGEVRLSHYGTVKFKTITNGVDVPSGGLFVGGTEVITSARNLSNIGTISSGDITSSGDFIGDTFGTSTNKITWSIANNARIFTNGAERLRVDSLGKLLVGKTSGDTTNTVGHELKPNGIAVHTSDGTGTLFLNRKTSHGNIIELRKDNSAVGVIGTQNWGIGTSSPSEALHVVGNILTSGGVKVGDSSADALHFFGILKQGSGSGTTVMDSSRNLTNIGTISSGAITSTGASSFGTISSGTITVTGNVDVNGGLLIDVEQINGVEASGWLDFNMDTDSVYPQSTTDNQTVLGSVTHMNFVGDSNANGTGGIFYWGHGVNNTDSGTFTQTMSLDRSGNLTTAGTISATSYSGALASTVTATTQSAGDNSTKVATTAYTDTAIANLADSAPSTLNTLNELAAALGDDANFSTTVTNSIATKLPLAGGTMTGQLLINVSGAGTTAMDVQGAYSSGGDVKLAQFKRSGGAVAAAIEYNDATTDMEFGTVTSHAFSLKTADTRRLTIDTSGNLLVGTTDNNVTNNSGNNPGINIGVAGIKGYIASARYQGAPLALNRLNNDGDIAVFQKDGTTIGVIGTKSGDLIAGTGDTGIRFDDANNAIYAHNTSTNAYVDDAISLGFSGIRFKDLYLSGQVKAQSLFIDSGGYTPQDAEGQEFKYYLVSQGTDQNFKKVADVTISTGSYKALALRVVLESQAGNFGNTIAVDKTEYVCNFYRSAASQDDQDTAQISGQDPTHHNLRIVKTATGVYELQVRQNANYRDAILKLEVLSTNGGTFTVTDGNVNGSTSGTITTPISNESASTYSFNKVDTPFLNIQNTIKVNSTQILDASRNLTNIGTISSGGITSTGNLSLTTTGSEIMLDAYNTSQEGGGIFFREGFQSSNKYNLSIIARSRSNDGSADGLSINGYEGVFFSTGSNSYQERFGIDVSGNIAVGGTTILDQSRNLTNIGTISSGAITSTGNSVFTGSGSSGNAFQVKRGHDGSQAFRVQNAGEVVVANNYLYASHTGTAFYSQGAAVFRNGILNDGGDLAVKDTLNITNSGVLKMASTTVMDASRNLTNIGTITASGDITTDDRIISKESSGGFYKLHTDGTFRAAFYDDNGNTAIYADGDGSNPFITFSGGATHTTDIDGILNLSNTNASLRIGGTEVISTGRNIANIGTISSGAITSSGDITLAANLKATGNNLKFFAGGNHIINIDLNGNFYPQTHNAVDLGFSDSLAFRNLHLVGAITGGATISSGAITVNTADLTIEGGANASQKGLVIKHTGQTGNQTILEQNSSSSFGRLRTTERALRIEAGQSGGTGTSETLSFHTNGSQAMTIDTSQRVGIGTTSPASLLSVQGDGLQIRLDGTANTSRGILLRNTGTAEGQIQTDGNMHFIQEDASRYMRFSTANTERMRITSDGKLLIGTTSTTPAFSTGNGHAFHIGDASHISRSGGTTLIVNRSSSNGNIVDLRFGGTNIGAIGSEGGDSLFIQGGTSSGSGLLMHGTGAKVLPLQNGASVDATIDLGQSSRRFKDLHLAGDLFLPYGSINDSGTDLVIHGTNAVVLKTDGGTAITIPNNSTDINLGSGKLNFSRTSEAILLDSAHSKTKIGLFGGIGTGAEYIGTSANTVEISGTNINFNGASGSGTPNLKMGTTTVIDSSRNLSNIASLGVGGSAGTQYPGFFQSGQRYLIGIKNTASGVDGNYPWLVHDNSNSMAALIVHFNGVGDRMTLREDGNAIFSGDVTAFSDERLKYNIQTLDGKKALQMRGVSYIRDGKEGSGVIAQEIEKIAPELVITADDEQGTKSVAYGNLVGYLIEAIKDQQDQIEYMKSEIKVLKEANNGNK